MALARYYTVDSGAVSIGGISTQTAILQVATTSTAPVNVACIRAWVTAGASPVFPSNANIDMIFARATNTPSGGTTTTPTPHQAGGLAANSAWTIGSWSTAPTAPSATAGGILWGEGLPITAGAGYGEWTNAQAEWNIAQSAFAAIFVTPTSAPTSVNVRFQVVFAE